MQLTFDQIRAISFGVDHFEETNDTLYVHRNSQITENTWGTLRAGFEVGARAPAGVRLDFYTDSAFMKILPNAPGPFDLLVDDRLIRSYAWEDYADADGYIRTDLPAGEHRVTLLFPHHSQALIGVKSVELSDGASLRPYTYSCKILLFVDSITHGTGAATSYFSYAWRLARALDADVRNLAVGGTFFAPMPFPEKPDFEPDIIIIAYGTNDWGFFSGPDRLELRSREFLDKICTWYPNAKIFGISPLWREACKETRSVGTFDVCCQLVKQAHLNHGITVVDGYDMIPAQGRFFTDGLHPNDTGHGLYAENLLQFLRAHL